MSDAANDARRAEWRLHDLNAEMMHALEESGGEVTPEVEAIEKRIGESVDRLAVFAANLHNHCKGQLTLCKIERARLSAADSYWSKLKVLAARWTRVAAEEYGFGEGGAFDVGTFRVWTTAPRPRVVVNLPTNESSGYVEDRAALDPAVRRDLDALARRGLGRWDFRPNKTEAAKELEKGAELPAFRMEYPTERTVVVK